MENTNTLERLNTQVGALIDALKTAREDIARLNDELASCRAVTSQREENVNALEESLGLKDMELEDLAERIEEVLKGSAAEAAPESAFASSVQPVPGGRAEDALV